MDQVSQATPILVTTKHDKVYTTLLGVLAFFFVVGAISLMGFASNPRMPEESRAVFRMTSGVLACYIAACIAVVLIRILAPAHRKWPTFGLNIILLLYFPIGTPLAIYGFWKVDKKG
jgi:hypothetical protein